MNVRVLAEAEAELEESEAFYRAESAAVADRFLEDFEATASLLEAFPKLGKAIDGKFRTIPLRRYPFSLIYEVESDAITIIAVAHQSRRPGYWRGR